MNSLSTRVRHKSFGELLILLGLVAITAILTWPWLLQLRSGVPDYGDPYSISYFIWWDYHQTFKDPLNLFHATIFYPYRYSLAFGEYDYGVSLLFFPLFALGVRPLTIYNIAAFLSFPFTAYGTFRLARTLSGHAAVGWIAGIVVGFVPFRFHHLSHLHLIFAGWIPLLFEALVLFARNRTWRGAIWLGIAFFMNALTCTTWLILTAIPLTASGLVLIIRNRLWFESRFWIRGFIALTIGSLLLLPFLIPYARVAQTNGFARSEQEVLEYSAKPINWLAAEKRNRLWRGFGSGGARNEMMLFPGLLAPLLALAGLLLRNSFNDKTVGPGNVMRRLIFVFDLAMLVCLVLALLSVGYNGFRLRPLGFELLSISNPTRCLIIVAITLLLRCWLAYPAFARNLFAEKNLRETIANTQRPEVLVHGFIWLLIGVAGSFGLNFFFHRFLYEFVPGFQGMRVAVRWAMIAYVGLALLAGAGALKLIASLGNQYSSRLKSTALGVVMVALLLEFNVAPLELLRGHPDPDALSLHLKSQRLKGGIIELPAGDRNHMYMLRAIDHEHPLVNANDSFVSPLALEVERVTSLQPDVRRFIEILEQTPVSYVTVHNSLLTPEQRLTLEKLLAQVVAEGALAYVGSFTSATSQQPEQRDDLYAVTRIEPGVPMLPAAEIPDFLKSSDSPIVLPKQLDASAFAFYRLHKLTFGRPPTYSEFNSAIKTVSVSGTEISLSISRAWVERPEFKNQFQGKSDEQFKDTLLRNAGLEVPYDLVAAQVSNQWRADFLRLLANHKAFIAREVNSAFVITHYFRYLNRDPDEGGYKFWLQRLDKAVDYDGVNQAFANSPERK